MAGTDQCGQTASIWPGISSCYIQCCGRALEWVLRHRGMHHVVHYLNDFLLLGSPGSSECQWALDMTIATCQELGVPFAPEKFCGPSTSLSFLGVILDATSMSAQLPTDKLKALLELFLRSKTIQDQRSLQSLVGHLVHSLARQPLFPLLRHRGEIGSGQT